MKLERIHPLQDVYEDANSIEASLTNETVDGTDPSLAKVINSDSSAKGLTDGFACTDNAYNKIVMD